MKGVSVNKNIIIPKDIKKIITKNKRKDILKLVLLLAVFAVIALSLGLSYFRAASVTVKTVAFTLWMIIPFLYTRIFEKLYRKPFFGTVEGIQVTDYIETSAPMKGAYYLDSSTKNTIVIFVRKRNGDVVRIPALIGSVSTGDFLDFFRIGDKVICLPYSSFVQKLPSENDNTINCVICGTVQDNDRSKCAVCGHTLHLLEENSVKGNKVI